MTTLQSMNSMGGAQQIKKPRSEAGPSAILHVRNLPQDCVEYELRAVIPPQFPIVKVFIVQVRGAGAPLHHARLLTWNDATDEIGQGPGIHPDAGREHGHRSDSSV